MDSLLLTLLKTFATPVAAMTKGGEEVGRTVPAERANPLLITLLPSFIELLSPRGAEGLFLFLFFLNAYGTGGTAGKDVLKWNRIQLRKPRLHESCSHVVPLFSQLRNLPADPGNLTFYN